MTAVLSIVESALDALRAGRPVVVTDEHQSAVILAAALANPAAVAWAVRHSSGFLAAAMESGRADELDLPPMVAGAADTVAVDAAFGITTGISATDRAHTARVLADPASTPGDLRRPGHLLGMRAAEGGVLARADYPEAAVDLCRLAGLPAIGITATLVTDGCGLATRTQAELLARDHDVPVLALSELVDHRWRAGENRVRRGTTNQLTTVDGTFTVIAYRDQLTGVEHLALCGSGGTRGPIAVHRECPTGDLLGSTGCDCRARLERAMAEAANGGTVVYLRSPESTHQPLNPADTGALTALLRDLGLPEPATR